MLNEKETKLFSDELIDALNNKKEEKHWNMKCYVDGEPKNINPLTNIPEPQMRLYGFSGIFKSAFFDTEEELIKYIKETKLGYGSVCIMDYLGTVADKSDVIRLTYESGKSVLYTAVNEDGYIRYNPERSFYKGEFVWEYNHGQISEMYSAFRDRGIVFENDIYAKIDESYKRFIEMCEKSKREQILTKKRTTNNFKNKNN